MFVEQKFLQWLTFAAFVVILLSAGIFIFVTLPPRTIVMATGPEGGANHELGIRYREILAKAGVRLRLLPSTAAWKIWHGCAIPGQGSASHSSRVVPRPGWNRRSRVAGHRILRTVMAFLPR